MSDYYYDNIYDSPADFGVEKIAEIDISSRDYEYDIIGVWKADGKLYMGNDSGCSCPIPFDNFKGLDSLTGPLTVEQVLEEANSLKAVGEDMRSRWLGDYKHVAEEWPDFENAVREQGSSK